MAAGPETRLVGRIREAILKHHPNAWVFKVHGNPYQDAGVPDLLVGVRGLLVGIEVKAQQGNESRERALGRVTLRQQATLNDMARAGCTVGVALSVDEALALVSAALSGAGQPGEGEAVPDGDQATHGV